MKTIAIVTALLSACVSPDPTPAAPEDRACPGVMEVASMHDSAGRFTGVAVVAIGPVRYGAVWPEWRDPDGSTIIGPGAVVEASTLDRPAWIPLANDEIDLAIRYVPYDGSPGCLADVPTK